MTKLFIAITIFIVGSISCNDSNKDMQNIKEPIISTFYFIRHAEKDRTDPENKDPELNQDGLGRAIRWAEVFDPIVLDTIYSTDYKRTSMTAAPTSVKKAIDISYYDPNTLEIETFKKEHEGLNVLVVGHSNTTPQLVNKILGVNKYSSMDDHDNSSLFIVRFVDGVATDIRLNMD
ncbi:MAG: phosphoglycerate mutase family protein [Flavobacteriaceae bacterium]